MSNIGYKIGGIFRDSRRDGIIIGFDILFPFVYDTEEDAETIGIVQTKAAMEKCDNGEVVIQLYELGRPVEIVRWEEWWKYRCYCLKKESKGKKRIDGRTDFEPYNARFETIFESYSNYYIGSVCSEMQFVAYWIEPVERREEQEVSIND